MKNSWLWKTHPASGSCATLCTSFLLQKSGTAWCMTQHDTWTDRPWCQCLTTAVLSMQAYTQRWSCTRVFPYCHAQHTHGHAHTDRQTSTATAMEGHATVQTLQARKWSCSIMTDVWQDIWLCRQMQESMVRSTRGVDLTFLLAFACTGICPIKWCCKSNHLRACKVCTGMSSPSTLPIIWRQGMGGCGRAGYGSWPCLCGARQLCPNTGPGNLQGWVASP